MFTGRDHVTCDIDAVSGKRQFLGLIRLSGTGLLDPHLGFPPIEITVCGKEIHKQPMGIILTYMSLDFLFHVMR